jgi:hypothetical protein
VCVCVCVCVCARNVIFLVLCKISYDSILFKGWSEECLTLCEVK